MDAEQKPLTGPEKAMLAEYQQAIRDLQQQMQGAAALMVRSRGLEGKWTFQGESLVKAE